MNDRRGALCTCYGELSVLISQHIAPVYPRSHPSRSTIQGKNASLTKLGGFEVHRLLQPVKCVDETGAVPWAGMALQLQRGGGNVCVCVCVRACVRERERERARESGRKDGSARPGLMGKQT